MLEARILSGQQAGTVVPITRFPFSFGRSEADCVFREPGVWDRHFLVTGGDGRRFGIQRAQADAQLQVDGATAIEASLRNGSMVTCGSVRIEFRIAPARQRSQRFFGALSWMTVIFVVLLEVLLVSEALWGRVGG